MTRIPPEYTRPHGCEELHAVFFQHRDDPGGDSATVSIMIPEMGHMFDTATATTRQLRARLCILCDTAGQARAARQAALERLPEHREVALERAEAGAWGIQ